MPYKDPEKAKARYKRYRIANKAKIQAYQKEYRKLHVEERKAYQKKYNMEHIAEARERLRQWRKNNPIQAKQKDIEWKNNNVEKVKIYVQRCYINNRKKWNDRVKEWRFKNPQKVRHYYAINRAKRQGAEGSHSLQEWNEKQALYGNRCFYCGKKPKKLQREHVIPLTKGGTDHIWNIVPACQSCNGKKHTKMPEDFFLMTTGQINLAF